MTEYVGGGDVGVTRMEDNGIISIGEHSTLD